MTFLRTARLITTALLSVIAGGCSVTYNGKTLYSPYCVQQRRLNEEMAGVRTQTAAVRRQLSAVENSRGQAETWIWLAGNKPGCEPVKKPLGTSLNCPERDEEAAALISCMVPAWVERKTCGSFSTKMRSMGGTSPSFAYDATCEMLTSALRAKNPDELMKEVAPGLFQLVGRRMVDQGDAFGLAVWLVGSSMEVAEVMECSQAMVQSCRHIRHAHSEISKIYRSPSRLKELCQGYARQAAEARQAAIPLRQQEAALQAQLSGLSKELSQVQARMRSARVRNCPD